MSKISDELREQADMWERSGSTMYTAGAVSLLRRWADELDRIADAMDGGVE